MTASEFAFLALGLVLGVLSGVALVEVLRSRPPSPREVRLTVTPNSVPRRRAVTLAEDAFEPEGADAAPGGPAERLPQPPSVAPTPRPAPPVAPGPAPPDVRTPVRPAPPLPGTAVGPPVPPSRPPVPVRIHHEPDWALAALRAAASRDSVAVALLDAEARERNHTAAPPRWETARPGGREGGSMTGPAEPAIARLLRGDAVALNAVAARLADDQPDAQRRWQLAIGRLVEAIVAAAIDRNVVTLPADHPFWQSFDQADARRVVGGLASLGYRFDGLGGWVDERVPGARELSVAVGHAGLDRMGIRQWPSEAEMADLFAEVTVAADEYLVGAAPGLTRDELTDALGDRAGDLADVWADWERVRSALLTPA